jgi:excisionase family DNA binding protein
MTGPYVPIGNVARHLGVSEHTVRGWVRRGAIPPHTYIRIGNTYRFSIEDVVGALTTRPKAEVDSVSAQPGGVVSAAVVNDSDYIAINQNGNLETDKDY